MDEEQARETEAEETREEESGDTAEEESAQEQQQEVEEHDWGAMTARIDALEEQVQAVTEALATLSVEKEGHEDESEPEFGEDGEALDLGELNQFLGL